MSDVASLKKHLQKYETLKKEISKVIVGQDAVIEQILISIFSGGHSLLVGVPGLAKTLMVNTIAKALGLDFKRIQFTPDLMPSDILGSEILDNDRQFKFIKGPIFSNIILADEINRTPPKTQAALLEAMQERSVTIAGHHYKLDSPYFVLATQNPIEQEGTYPLPEAQQDRFMFKVFVQYPSFSEEFEIAQRTTGTTTADVKPILTASEIIALQKSVREVPLSDHIARYAIAIVRQTRVGGDGVPEFVSDQLAWGAGPRAVQYLILGCKARALLQGRSHVTIEDVQALAAPVLRHRIVVGFAAESEGVTADSIIKQLIETTPAHEDELTRDPRFQTIFAS